MHNQPREPQPYEDCQAKSIQEFCVNFTKNGLKLGSRHQKPPHTDVSRNLATVVVRGVLPGLSRRRTGLLPSGPKSSFQMRASFVFPLETKVLESGGRVEKLIAQVKFPKSLMIWGTMSSSGVGPLCFLKTNVTAPVYQDILEDFMLPSADQLFEDADFIFQQDVAPAHTAKSTKSWLNDHGVGVLDWPVGMWQVPGGTRSRKIRCVLRDPTGLVRTWRYPRKVFCHVYIRAAQLIVKNSL